MISDFFYAYSLVDISVKHSSNQIYTVFGIGNIRDSQRVVEYFICKRQFERGRGSERPAIS
jgi:hypothetical protein